MQKHLATPTHPITRIKYIGCSECHSWYKIVLKSLALVAYSSWLANRYAQQTKQVTATPRSHTPRTGFTMWLAAQDNKKSNLRHDESVRRLLQLILQFAYFLLTLFKLVRSRKVCLIDAPGHKEVGVIKNCSCQLVRQGVSVFTFEIWYLVHVFFCLVHCRFGITHRAEHTKRTWRTTGVSV